MRGRMRRARFARRATMQFAFDGGSRMTRTERMAQLLRLARLAERGNTTATTSSGPMPRATNIRAIRAVSRASSP